MRSKSLWFRPWLSGLTFGGSSGGQPVPLVVLTVIVLAMAVVTVIDGAVRRDGFDSRRKIPFKCINCGNVQHFTIRELMKIQPAGQGGPMPGPMVLPCEKCGKKALTQAVECPKCSEIFIMKVDPVKGIFDDRCPKCGANFSVAWQEKYHKNQGR